MTDDRPLTEWEARVARAKSEGTWFGPDEEPSPYPLRVRRLRFWCAFSLALVTMMVLGALLHIAWGRPGSPISGGALVDGLFRSLVPAFFVGWSSTRPPRRKRDPSR